MNRLRSFFAQWINAIKTFPIAHLVLISITSFLIYTISFQNSYPYRTPDELMRIIIACIFTLPLTVIPALTTYITQKWEPWNKKDFFLSLVGIVIWVLYYSFLPIDFNDAITTQQITTIWWLFLAWAVPFFCIAYATRHNDIFTRTRRKAYKLSILFGLLGWWIIRAWISACIASLDYLFGVTINSNMYEYIGSVAMVLIAWSIWLIHLLQQQLHTHIPEYSRSMRIFGHYIFLPLTLLYAIILLSYGVKILITGLWPQGTVVYMVIGYVLFGLATRYSTYPALPNRWVARAHNILFITFALTSLLMIKAIRLRISQYGITIDRYFVCMIIIGIILMSILALLLPKYRHFITISTLMVLGVISIYGWPLSAKNIATNSQKKILTQTLIKNNITLPLQSWSLAQIASGDAGKIYGPISYLARHTDSNRSQSFFSAEQQTLIEKQNRYMQGDYILNYLWLQYTNSNYFGDDQNTEEYFSYSTSYNNILNSQQSWFTIAWYTSLYPINEYKNTKDNILSLSINSQITKFDLTTYLEEIYKNRNNQPWSAQQTTQAYTITQDTYKLILTDISWYKKSTETGTTYTLTEYRWYVLMK